MVTNRGNSNSQQKSQQKRTNPALGTKCMRIWQVESCCFISKKGRSRLTLATEPPFLSWPRPEFIRPFNPALFTWWKYLHEGDLLSSGHSSPSPPPPPNPWIQPTSPLDLAGVAVATPAAGLVKSYPCLANFPIEIPAAIARMEIPVLC